jgi:hypothetical protein
MLQHKTKKHFDVGGVDIQSRIFAPLLKDIMDEDFVVHHTEYTELGVTVQVERTVSGKVSFQRYFIGNDGMISIVTQYPKPTVKRLKRETSIKVAVVKLATETIRVTVTSGHDQYEAMVRADKRMEFKGWQDVDI